MELETNFKTINKKPIYSIKDVVVGEFGDIMILPNEAAMKRQFNFYMKRIKEQGKETNDFQLYKLGEINLETGEISSAVKFIQQGEDQ